MVLFTVPVYVLCIEALAAQIENTSCTEAYLPSFKLTLPRERTVRIYKVDKWDSIDRTVISPDEAIFVSFFLISGFLKHSLLTKTLRAVDKSFVELEIQKLRKNTWKYKKNYA